ncbi:hypothetical protein LSCM1_04902 [Leishmania martiniquensis]|uniref:Uncharacterized protein n=1 Tax=Leishmania martiniquensis TaxID=1580590 RepID=A0A836HUW8_9TRYP|nr:hypothetical protein LSCM1_04902 [Leishmania martiniquensis]
MYALVAAAEAPSPACAHSPRNVQRRVCGDRELRAPSPLLRLLPLVVVGLLLPLPAILFSCVSRRSDTGGPCLWEDVLRTRSAVTPVYGRTKVDSCAARPRATAVPRVLMAHAASAELFTGDGGESDGADTWGTIALKRKLDYDSGLKPFMAPWSEVRRALRDAGCFSTLALPRLRLPTDTASPHLSHGAPELSTALPPLCRKPLVLMSGRGRNCASCSSFASDVLGHYQAEWEYIRAHVTLVDAGDPMTEELVRHPYPLWYSPAEVEQLLTLTRLPNASPADDDAAAAAPGAGSTSGASSNDGAQTLQQADDDDFIFFNAGLRHRAAFLLHSPTPQATRKWSRDVKRAFAGQSEYVLRIVFAYPHNGSVMRDIVNEEVTLSESRADHLHFFDKGLPFFRCVTKAVRVMEWLQRHGDY